MVSHALLSLGILCLAAGALVRIRRTAVEALVPTAEVYRQTIGRRLGRDSDRLWFSVEGLRSATPEMAFDRTLSRGQKEAVVVAATVFALALTVSWNITLVVVVSAVIFVYFAALSVRFGLFVKALNHRGVVDVSDEVARGVPDEALPRYSILIPAYNEPEVIGSLVDNIRMLDYPQDRLEAMLLLESDDAETILAARRAVGHLADIQVVLVPGEGPRTKPKACNYGLATCTGDIVTIYDAEDRPEPLQLRKAAVALATAPPDVACVQAKLAFFNSTQNLLTRWFTLDYRMWFSQLLPGLVQIGSPIPLGGTSNHFRRAVLLEIGGWDAYNVTEDADLGIRLSRRGYRTAVLESITYEEANSDVVNWVKQRSRWYKGYAQTALVHLRHPIRLRRDLGTKGFVLFFLFVGGTPLLAMLNPVFWALTIVWWTFHPHVIHQVIPTLTYFIGQLCWVAGNCFVLYTWILSTRQPRERLWSASLLAPLYWVLMSVAATKAVVQLVTAPSYWEKTQHGLDGSGEAPGPPVQVAS